MNKNTTHQTLVFYESLALDYHLLFMDWHASIEQQADSLDSLVRSELGDRMLVVRDCACGIGTQALGLAQKGHQVWASDLSPAAVARARKEAQALGLEVSFQVADFLELSREPAGAYEVVLACDNALPHLLTREEVQLAATNLFERLVPGGMVLISTRDYDSLLETRPLSTPVKIMGSEDTRRVTFQLWDWLPVDDVYNVQQFLVEQGARGWTTRVFQGTYKAWRRDVLTDIFQQAGFSDLRWLFPEDTRYYQPVMIGRRQDLAGT